MPDYMLTLARKDTYKEWNEWIRFFRRCDIHKWIIGAEVGDQGYEHWQICFRSRLNFNQMKALFPKAHIEELKSENAWIYSTKEGKYLASWDTPEVRQQRWGRPTKAQKRVIEAIGDTNDRQVVVWYDPKGNAGKSWITAHLFETGQAYYLPPWFTNVQGMIQSVANMCLKDRKMGYPPRKIVLIDIPRTWKWSEQLYIALECIKDGLIMEPRYEAQPINVHGIKVCAMTNSMPDRKKLSEDRWVIIDNEALQDEAQEP